jgi:hypothetical protein
VPVAGFTWYSLTDQVDWHIELREARGIVNPRGLYDLDRRIRPVGTAYRDLIAAWNGRLSTNLTGGADAYHKSLTINDKKSRHD